MAQRKVIAVDVNGVLADFREAFTKLGRALYNTEVVKTQHAKHLNDFGGMTDSEIETIREATGCMKDFLSTLRATCTWEDFKRLNELQSRVQVYFITAQQIPRAYEQTHMWLRSRGIDYPQIIMTQRKGEACNVIGADFYIGDKVENVNCAAWLSPQTKSCLLRFPSNVTSGINKKVIHVDTLGKFLTLVEQSL